jgi:ubiquinone/menaquinone biosynthesis C-methylase UbiE
MGLWADRVLPGLIEKACRSGEILEERQRWVPRAHGRVLELGVGTGLNLAFYDPTRVEQVVAIDPSAALLARAQARATAAPVPVELRAANAEALPFAAASFDSVLVTYSLCSIDQLGAALAETRRVVRPGGEVIFVEHGRAPDPGPRRWQRWLTPAWRRIGGGCRLDRDIAAAFLDAGFALPELETAYGAGRRWLSYTYQGVARR